MSIGRGQYKRSKETIAKLRASMSGERNPMYGKEKPAEQLKRQSESMRISWARRKEEAKKHKDFYEQNGGEYGESTNRTTDD